MRGKIDPFIIMQDLRIYCTLLLNDMYVNLLVFSNSKDNKHYDCVDKTK